MEIITETEIYTEIGIAKKVKMGHYCIAYLTKRCRRQDMKTVVNQLKPKSDMRIGHLVEDVFDIDKFPRSVQSGGGKRHKRCINQVSCAKKC